MRPIQKFGTCLSVLAALGALLSARGDEPAASVRQALTLEAVRPEEQGRRLIGLFAGAKSPHPAAALAAWKRTPQGQAGLGKPVEAAIAALNPQMVRELRVLDGAELRLLADPGTGTVQWLIRAPADDGTLAAFATALALTDGKPLEPLGDASVMRLGPPGSPLAATRPGMFAVAPTRDQLLTLLGPRPLPTRRELAQGHTGWRLRIDTDALATLSSVDTRRVAAALKSLKCPGIDGWLSLEGSTLHLHATAQAEGPGLSTSPIEPAWLDPVPAERLLGLAVASFGADGEGLDTLFAVADRVEKADPGREQLAPLRTRLDLLIAAARVRPGVDLWSALRGATAAVLVDGQGEPASVLVGLHATDAAAARRLADVVLSRLATRYARAPKEVPPGDGPRTLGTTGGQPILAELRGTSVWVGWGDGVLEASRDAASHPDRSAGPIVRAGWGASAPQRLGAFWPGRWRRMVPAGSVLAAALEGAPPIVWTGRNEKSVLVDDLRWPALDAAVKRGLVALPQAPPPDRSTSPGNPPR